MVVAVAGLALAGASGAAGASGSGAVRAGGASGAPGSGLDVLPFPGTPDAAPGTNIDFPAVAPAEIAAVTVVGSLSGRHGGRLSAQPGGQGTAFTPDRPFAPGERVSVTATFRTAAAAAASGASGQRRLRFSFGVARTASLGAGAPTPASLASYGVASAGSAPASQPLTHTFVTEPGLHPPVVTMSGKVSDAGAGDIFLDAEGSGQNAAYILGPHGALLWYRPTATQAPGPQARDVRVQTYHGQQVLTYWLGTLQVPPGGGNGVDQILNEHYQTIATVHAGNGLQSYGTDLHEFVLSHEGSRATAYVTIWKPFTTNLSKFGGPTNGTAIDWIIQEIDIATGKVIWEWHAFGHVPLGDTHAAYIPGQPFEWFHLNSIQPLSNGHVIISARNTWAVYAIDKKSGKVLWELGGKHSSFRMGSGTNFEWQHDAELHGNGLLTLFDDAAVPAEEHQSRALELHVGINTHRATLVHAYTHSPSVLAGSEGSVQTLADGNVFVGWGSSPFFSEVSTAGRQLFGGSFRGRVESYRAYRFGNWVGSPLQPPAIAAGKGKSAGDDYVYVSWNGATQVAKWQVYAATSINSPFKKVGAPVPWQAFETTISVPLAGGHDFKVVALGSSGKPLPGGTSAVVVGP